MREKGTFMSLKKVIGIAVGAGIGFLVGYLGKCASPGGIG